MFRIIALTIVLSLLVGGGPAFGSVITPEDRLAQVFQSETVNSDWFAPAFLAHVPLAQIQVIAKQYRDMLGVYERAEGVAPAFKLIFSNGSAPSQIVLDSNGQIASFWIGLPQPKVSGLDEVLANFTALPGQVSVLIASENGVLASIAPDARLAVGSTFKLAVLAALKDKIKAGSLAWDSIVALADKHISLPTGILQTWPVGTPLTVQAAASLMMSISDNTATDMLIEKIGRESIEPYAPQNKPLLTTREVFTLKNAANAALLESYRQGDTQKKRDILPTVANAPIAPASTFSGAPVALDIEWFFTVAELANLMAYVQDLPLMSINPGVAAKENWKRIAYKGGSEPGVLNMTTWLVSNAGQSYVVSATWNNTEPLDDTRFITLYSSMIEVLRQREN